MRNDRCQGIGPGFDSRRLHSAKAAEGIGNPADAAGQTPSTPFSLPTTCTSEQCRRVLFCQGQPYACVLAAGHEGEHASEPAPELAPLCRFHAQRLGVDVVATEGPAAPCAVCGEQTSMRPRPASIVAEVQAAPQSVERCGCEQSEVLQAAVRGDRAEIRRLIDEVAKLRELVARITTDQLAHAAQLEEIAEETVNDEPYVQGIGDRLRQLADETRAEVEAARQIVIGEFGTAVQP